MTRARSRLGPLRLLPPGAALLLGAFTASAQPHLQPQALPTLDCVITPYAVVDVSSPVPGVLGAVHVDRSDPVQQGQVVAELDSGVERASLALAEARAGMDTEIRLGQVNLQFDTRQRDRLDSLYSKQVLSYHDKDRAERDVALSEWRLRQARDVLQLRALELVKAQEVLDQKAIRTPIAGVVVQRFKSPGEYVEEQPILRVVQLDPLYVEAIVPMELFGHITPGMAAVVVPETVASDPHRATVDVVDQMGDAASGTYGVRLLLPNPDHALPAGQKCTVRFLAGEQAPATPDPAPAEAAAPVDEGKGANGTRVGSLTPTVATQAVCRTIGPLDASDQTAALAGRLESTGFRVRFREEVELVPAGYVVLDTRDDEQVSAAALEARLREKGVEDFGRIYRGKFAGRVSLGVYDREANAGRRRSRLAALGVDTVVEMQTRSRERVWLDVEIPVEHVRDGSFQDTVRDVGTEQEPEVTACPAILAAGD